MQRPVTVRVLEEEPGAWWDDLCDRAGSPWHARAFARLQAAFGVETNFLLAEGGGEPVGALALQCAGSRAMPALDPLFARTAFIPDEPAVAPGAEGVHAALLDAAEDRIRESGAVAATIRVELPRAMTPADLEARGYEVSRRGVGVLDLPAEEAGLEEVLGKTARKNVRRAAKAGIVAEVAPGVERLLPLLDRSFARAGLPARDHRFVRAAHEHLGGEVLVARKGTVDVAALLWGRVGRFGLNMFHGRADGETEGASDLLHHEMFVHAIRAGVRTIHTGDAALPGESDPRLLGITRFKEKLGFEVRPAFQGQKTLRPVAAAVRDASVRLWAALRGGT